jgi:hypothetical protein
MTARIKHGINIAAPCQCKPIIEEMLRALPSEFFSHNIKVTSEDCRNFEITGQEIDPVHHIHSTLKAFVFIAIVDAPMRVEVVDALSIEQEFRPSHVSRAPLSSRTDVHVAFRNDRYATARTHESALGACEVRCNLQVGFARNFVRVVTLLSAQYVWLQCASYVGNNLLSLPRVSPEGIPPKQIITHNPESSSWRWSRKIAHGARALSVAIIIDFLNCI